MVETLEHDSTSQDESTADYQELFAAAHKEGTEVTNDRLGLPAPHLDDAINTAFGELLVRGANPDSDVNSKVYNRSPYNYQEIRAVSEKEYLEATQTYLDDCLAAAQSHDPEEIAKNWEGLGPENETFKDVVDRIQDFKENLVYINNAEFEKATDAMAEQILIEAEAGNLVGVFSYRDRSPEYICVKVLDKVRRILESSSNYSPEEAAILRDRIIYSDSANNLVKELTQKPKEQDAQTTIYALDDFALSGSLLGGALKRVSTAVNELSQGDIDVKGLVICSNQDLPDIDSVYIPPKSKNFSNIAVAGSWSSTDYGFEGVLDHFATRLGIQHPLDTENTRHMIKGRYEQNADGQYLDPQYTADLNKVIGMFGAKAA